MRLVIATPLYPPDIGGPATYVKLLEEGLCREGMEIAVVKFGDVRHLPKIFRHYVYYRRVLRAARNADVVLALDPVSVGLPAMCAARKARKPFVVKVVGDYAWEQGQQRYQITMPLDEFVQARRVPLPVVWFRRIQTRVAMSAVKVIVPSAYLKRIVALWGIPQEKIEVIYNAVTLEEPGKVPEAVDVLPQPLVVTVGRLVPWKHIDGIIDAVARISNASLAVVGAGPLHASLVHHAETRLPGRAVFTGTLSPQDTFAVMKSANVLVLNSSYEGLSHLLIEALTLGVPTIATRVGGNPEVIMDGENGVLVPAGDTPALSDALAHVFRDDAFRTRLTAAAQGSVERFSASTMLSRTAALLRTL